jgi:small subunit ribosomal protein S13
MGSIPLSPGSFFLKMKFHFVDTLIPFRRKGRKLDDLNLFQFLSQRFGLGNSLSLLLCNHLGFSRNLKISDVRRSYLSEKLRKFFVIYSENLDKSLKETYINNILNKIKLRTYKGFRHSMRYPSNGQRTRSNAQTRKRFNIK